MEMQIWTVVATACGGLLLGALSTAWWMGRRVTSLRTDKLVLEAKLRSDEQLLNEREKQFQAARHELSSTFSALAEQSLRMNADSFLKLAREHLGQHQIKAQADLESRQQAIDGVIKPIHEGLQATRDEINQMEKRRQSAFGDIERNLKSIGDTQHVLHQQTHQLVGALRSHSVRGRWGEISLRRLVELAGMVEHCDFVEQDSQDTAATGGSGIQRPDMVIRLPQKRAIIVDAKTPLQGYLDAMEATDEATERSALKNHAKQVRERVRSLATKKYWDNLNESAQFVVLFLPGDPFLTAALTMDQDLLEDAFSKNVILATPSSLLALLKATAFGWQQQDVHDNVERILKVANTLQQRFSKFAEHFAHTGTRLRRSVESYNLAVNQFERGVVPQTDRLAELGVQQSAKRPDPDAIDTTVRILENKDDGDVAPLKTRDAIAEDESASSLGSVAPH